MNTQVKPPIITNEMIDYLDYMFRDQCPDIKLSDKEVWFDAGAVSVVRHLKHVKRLQEQNILTEGLT